MTHLDLSRVSLVMCDWSGVVSDDRRPVHEANRRIFARYGKQSLPFEAWLKGTAVASARDAFINAGILEDSERLFLEFTHAYAEITASGMPPSVYPDAKEFFREQHRLEKALYVVSAHPSEHLLTEATGYGITPYVRKFFGSTQDKVADIRAILERENIPVDRALYVGDMLHDIRAAKAAGVIPIAITTGYHSREVLEHESPALIVDSLRELGYRLHPVHA